MTPQTTHDPLERELSALFATPVSYDAGEVTESVHAGVRQVRNARRRRRVLAGTSALALAGVVTAAGLNGGFDMGDQLPGTGPIHLDPAHHGSHLPTPAPIVIPRITDDAQEHSTDPASPPVGPLSGTELRHLVHPERARRIDDVPVTDAPRLSAGLVQQQDVPAGLTTRIGNSLYTGHELYTWSVQTCPRLAKRPRGPEVEVRGWTMASDVTTTRDGRIRQRQITVMVMRYVDSDKAAGSFERLVTNTGHCRVSKGNSSSQYRVPSEFPVRSGSGGTVDLTGVSFHLVGDTVVLVEDASTPDQFGKIDTKRLADSISERIRLTNEG